MSGRRNLKIRLAIAAFLCGIGLQAQAGSIVGWGNDHSGQASPPAGNDFVAITGGYMHSLALKANGSIIGWGRNTDWVGDPLGQATAPDGNDFVAVAGGNWHSLALRSDGSIVAWGDNRYDQCNIPSPNSGFIAIAASGAGDHSLGLKADGSILAWGRNDGGQASAPAGNDFIAIAAGGLHSLALKADGSIVGWGRNGHGQATPPAGTTFVAIAAGAYHSLALKADGSIVAWGGNWSGQSNVPLPNSGFIAIAAGRDHSLGLKADGSIVAWGDNDHGQCNIPSPNTHFIAVAAGAWHSLAIRARIVYVDDDAPGANNGTSWEDAYNYLQDALVGAQSWDEIRVAQGVYRPDEFVLLLRPNLGRMETFALKNGVTIKGGYAGYGETNPEARNIELYETVLSGDLFGNDGPDFANNGENSYHVVNGSGTDATAVLDGFTITAGNANGTEPHSWGGGMYSDNGSPTILNCTFSGNSARYLGGGMCSREGNTRVFNCTFTGNSVSLSTGREISNGGGMFNWDSNSTVLNCTFGGNSAQDSGGGMCNVGNRSPTLENCTFSGNTASSGGAIENGGNSAPILKSCTFNGNTATSGGGMYNDESMASLIDCTFYCNVAVSGGGIYNDRSSSFMDNCRFIGNSAVHGGGMYNDQSQLVLTTCTLSGNSAELSGTIYNTNWGNLTLVNCTLTGNSTAANSGIIYCRDGSVTLTNCILWGNKAPDGHEIFLWDGPRIHSIGSVSYTDIQGGQTSVYVYPGAELNWGNGNIDADPCFIDSGYWDANETPEDANDDFWVDGDYHLLPDSPCINAGDPNFIAGPNDTDIDGESRVMLGRVDMGADEFNPFKVEFDVVEKRRIGRTVFEYDCQAILENISRFAVKNIQLTLAEASENMTIIEPNVTFGDIEVGPDESARSIDTCTFSVDRSQAIDPAKIIWHSACEMAGTGQTIEQTASSIIFLGAEDIPGDLVVDGQVDFADLAKLAGQWLWQGPEGSIPEDIVEDGAVNLADFAELAQKWGRN